MRYSKTIDRQDGEFKAVRRAPESLILHKAYPSANLQGSFVERSYGDPESLGQESIGAELKAGPNEFSSQALAREVGSETAPGIQVGFSIVAPLDLPIVAERTESDQLPILNRREKLVFPADQVSDRFLNFGPRMSVDGVRRVVAPRNEFGRVIT